MESNHHQDFDARAFCKTLPQRPGVYRMFDAGKQLIYVGKAKSLKQRVSSYFTKPNPGAHKTRALVSHIQHIEFTVTHTEVEALLLENNLIKQYRPKYNILWKDDKSYPWIYFSSEQDFPRLSFYRGARRERGRFFGPYPNAAAVYSSIHQLQKIFRIRNCQDQVFRNRTRACLQYQIKRCTAPCVGLISGEQYREEVQHALLFLEGKSGEVIARLNEKMDAAAAQFEYETAARWRDQIADLRSMQQHQSAARENESNHDILALVSNPHTSCIQILFVRGGRHLGGTTVFPHAVEGAGADELFKSFITQHYLSTNSEYAGIPIPEEILVNHPLADSGILQSALSEQAGYAVHIKHNVRGIRANWILMAVENANAALAQRELLNARDVSRMHALTALLKFPAPIERIECFDISHTAGEKTVAACVVFGEHGNAIKSDYRRFNIENITAGDDYAAMYQALERRYRRIQHEDGKLPGLLLIDGGRGQVKQATAVLAELGIADVFVLGVAKGVARKAGQEKLVLANDRGSITADAHSPALHLIQQIRDEAHRFAITGHRQRRDKTRRSSALEDISGIGAVRRRDLLKHFGGLSGIAHAAVADLRAVKGISREMAARIHAHFQQG